MDIPRIVSGIPQIARQGHPFFQGRDLATNQVLEILQITSEFIQE